MSAICGINNKDKTVNVNESEAVMKEIGKYRFDQLGTFYDGSLFLGCCLNQVTPESLNEILPYNDNVGSLVITADAIIDNREELLEWLSIPKEKINIPDSQLILRAYQRWGTACTERLVGDFTFAIWDKQKKNFSVRVTM